MSFKDLLKEVIANKPLNLKSPYFYKADSDAEKQLTELKQFYDVNGQSDKLSSLTFMQNI